jgi:hypothetical protein
MQHQTRKVKTSCYVPVLTCHPTRKAVTLRHVPALTCHPTEKTETSCYVPVLMLPSIGEDINFPSRSHLDVPSKGDFKEHSKHPHYLPVLTECPTGLSFSIFTCNQTPRPLWKIKPTHLKVLYIE